MAKTERSRGVFAKSALLWLTVAAVFASIYGAILSTREANDGLIRTTPDTLIADAGETYTE